MTDNKSLEELLGSLLPLMQRPFWQHPDFWIALVIGVGGLVFSVLAFIEARKAKKAATEAGRTVKIQTIIIDLTEIPQKLDKLRQDIRFSEARDLLAEISRRLRRLISPFQNDPELKQTILLLRETLKSAQDSLNSVRPTDSTKESDAPFAVYNAIESDFATINNVVADLLGLFEKKSINIGEENDTQS